MKGKTSCVCIEYCRQQQTRTWAVSGPSKHIIQEDIQTCSYTSILGGLLRGFTPEGYPHSVTPDYLGFQMWDSIQALMSYVRGMLCSQAIMTGIGVGEQASPCSHVISDLHALHDASCQQSCVAVAWPRHNPIFIAGCNTSGGSFPVLCQGPGGDVRWCGLCLYTGRPVIYSALLWRDCHDVYCAPTSHEWDNKARWLRSLRAGF